MGRSGTADIAILWLGEMLLIPHLWPIVDALARERPELVIDFWVSTSVHEELIQSWLSPDHNNIRLRRAPGFRQYFGVEPGDNPNLPAKLPMLLRLSPRLRNVRVVLCAEQTSLWLPRLQPGGPSFVFTVHGAGPLNYGRANRLNYAKKLLIPSRLDAGNHIANGIKADRIAVTGYAKASFPPSRAQASLFGDGKPILLYAPHWQRYRSSWWSWGEQIIDRLCTQQTWNVILAPHQRLLEVEPSVRAALERVRGRPGVIVDTGSFAMVDGSYTAAADIYLGDTSSQILEYLARPRPCVLLRPPGLQWNTQSSGDYWRCGEVVEDIDQLLATIARAGGEHGRFAAAQAELATAALGDTSAAAPGTAAAVIGDLFDTRAAKRRARKPELRPAA